MTDNGDVEAALLPSFSDKNPFPPIRLSADDKQTILDKVDLLLSVTLAQYESHLLEDRGAISEHQWKLVQRRDGFVSYRKRRTSPRASDSSKVHTVTIVGSIPGSVDDVLFGSVNPSADSAAAYTAFIFKESILGSVMLCPISMPNREHPDRFVALKWDAHGSVSSTLNRVVTPRDFVTAEAAGSTINSMGERVGYHFFHSVDVPGAPPLPGMLRGTKYFTFLYRQMSPEQVHVYVAGRVDPKGSVPTGVAVRATSSGIIETVLRTKRFAEIKKRTYLLRHHRQGIVSLARRLNSQYALEDEIVPGGRTCSVCGRTTSRVALLSSTKACGVCGKNACGSCFESKEVIMAGSTGNGKPIDIKRTAFCSLCLAAAHNLSGWDLAMAEVAASTSDRKGHEGGGCSSASSTADSSRFD